MIRPAELRDLNDIEMMFTKLLSYLMEKGHEWYAKDSKVLFNGIVAYLFIKMQHDNSLVLVHENDEGIINGFMIGNIIANPPFFEHKLAGQIEWHYPLSPFSRPMAREFEQWAQSKGATVGIINCYADNEEAIKLYEHFGMKLTWHYFTKEYKNENL